MKIKVYHRYYGCDSGCCGHIVEVDGDEVDFTFDHSPGTSEEPEGRAWARKEAERAIRERCPECLDKIDWDSMEVCLSDGSWC